MTTSTQRFKLTGFDTKNITSDFSAGLASSIDSVTGGMANAVLVGVNPMYGLYTVLAATPVAAIFTSSVFMNVDSTSAIAATAGVLLLDYPAEQRPSALAVLTLLIGFFMLMAGVLKLGFLTRFISNAVLRGFLTGIGVNIVLGQISGITGYESEYGNKLIQAVDTLLHLDEVNLQYLLVASVTMILVVTLDRLPKVNKLSLVIAITTASLMVPLLDLTTVPLVSSLGDLPDTLPRPVLPDLRLMVGLIGPAFALTIIALAQSAGISQAYANPDGKYPDSSRDFFGQGAANLSGALFQALPAAGSLSGTALLVKGGASSRWANVFVGLFAALIILVLGKQISNIALPALAGLLIVVGFQTINFTEINKIRHTSSSSQALMIATFIATLLVPLQWAIFFGVALSFAAFAYRESENTTVVEIVAQEGDVPMEQPVPAILPDNKVTSLHVYGSLFFAGARSLEEDLPQVDTAHNAVVVLNLRGHHQLGSTFIGVLERYVRALQASGNTLMLVNVHESAYIQLEETDCLDVLGRGNVFVADTTGASSRQAHQQAQQLIQARLKG
ncbi:MAG: SulP family inorganic anion transporter [Anaerolineae bacterium]|nr:SulP family inorganic anion transporter [Anaerolineae bacterium]